MTDHMAEARHRLDRLDDLRMRLAEEHARQPAPRQKVVAALYDEVRHQSKTAQVHATLAVAQALQDQGMVR